MSHAPAAAFDAGVRAPDGHGWRLSGRIPDSPRRSLLWLPALGVAARHYLGLAEALAARGVAVFVHEWRGHGSSDLRARRGLDWGYRELLEQDIPASQALVEQTTGTLPRLIGGHSLGGQLACCRLALAPATADGLWLVASGAPYWRAFPMPQRAWLPLAYRFLPWLATVNGVLPGRRIGFGGNEAAGLIRDWSRTGLGGRYAAAGLDADLEAALARLQQPVRGLLLAQDWLAPRPSLDFLLGKMPLAPARVDCLDARAAGTRADHYAWMKQPAGVADRFCAQWP